MKITNKTQHDPVTEVPQIEAYMRFALMTLEEMLGAKVLESILNENGMERLIGQYPSDNLKLTRNITHKDYANLCASVMNFYEPNGKEQSIRFGRISTKPALENQGILFNFTARMAIRLLPLSSQIKTVLDSIKNDLEKLYKDIDHEVGVKIEDRGDKWAYIDQGCAVCAGKKSDGPICWAWVGTLEESLQWMTGKEFEINQVECRAIGDDCCTWEISKTAKK